MFYLWDTTTTIGALEKKWYSQRCTHGVSVEQVKGQVHERVVELVFLESGKQPCILCTIQTCMPCVHLLMSCVIVVPKSTYLSQMSVHMHEDFKQSDLLTSLVLTHIDKQFRMDTPVDSSPLLSVCVR